MHGERPHVYGRVLNLAVECLVGLCLVRPDAPFLSKKYERFDPCRCMYLLTLVSLVSCTVMHSKPYVR